MDKLGGRGAIPRDPVGSADCLGRSFRGLFGGGMDLRQRLFAGNRRADPRQPVEADRKPGGRQVGDSHCGGCHARACVGMWAIGMATPAWPWHPNQIE